MFVHDVGLGEAVDVEVGATDQVIVHPREEHHRGEGIMGVGPVDQRGDGRVIAGADGGNDVCDGVPGEGGVGRPGLMRLAAVGGDLAHGGAENDAGGGDGGCGHGSEGDDPVSRSTSRGTPRMSPLTPGWAR